MTLLNDERFSLKINSIRLKCFQIENILIVNKFNEIEFEIIFYIFEQNIEIVYHFLRRFEFLRERVIRVGFQS